MSIQRPEYELSVWYETLGEKGQKTEIKENIIGAHDMTYLGRAIKVKLKTKLNGTHELTFQMPDKYFDSLRNEYVRNEFIDNLFNERKIKLYYKKQWLEFYIKTVTDNKNFKSYIKNYTCSDAFIDELSRNGYGITFDTELYNNVEEIGTFTEEVLDGSIWEYEPAYNWGDFTEYLEEKMFRIPVSQFETIVGHQLNYSIAAEDNNKPIYNVFTKQRRALEMGDDLAREKGYYWDQYNNGDKILNPLISTEKIENIENDGYIYVFYSSLDFCYAQNGTEKGYAATESVQYYKDVNNNELSYALAPNTVDPNGLIQFMAFPKNAVLEIDEAGLILNKDYHYVMTVAEWNETIKKYKDQVGAVWFYQFEVKEKKFLNKDEIIAVPDLVATGNYAVYYDGYLDKIGGTEVLYGKRISITDRTEINITDEIDQFVTVYNNSTDDFTESDIWTETNEWNEQNDSRIKYRICSKTETRQIVPQLARNLVENGTNIKGVEGWELQKQFGDDNNYNSNKYKPTTIEFVQDENSTSGHLLFTNYITNDISELTTDSEPYRTVLNFGLIGQETEITPDKIYVLGLTYKRLLDFGTEKYALVIGEGGVVADGEYKIDYKDKGVRIDLAKFWNGTESIALNESTSISTNYIFLQFKQTIKNPYIGFILGDTKPLELYNLEFFEGYTKGGDQFTIIEYQHKPGETPVSTSGIVTAEPYYRYSGRNLFTDIFSAGTIPEEDSKYSYIVNKNVRVGINGNLFYQPIEMRRRVLFEDDVMPGDTYGYQRYFIQQVQGIVKNSDGESTADIRIADTFKSKKILDENAKTYDINNPQLPFSSIDLTDEDLTIATKWLNLNACKYYNAQAAATECDCSYGNEEKKANKICLYQKYGYCPYRLQTEKHCRKIRTLKAEKSNRFNLTQSLSKVFEVYPIYYTKHDERGKVKLIEKTDDDGSIYYAMDKKVFYITEKGLENQLGFRYEKNLSSISRTIKSDQIVTKMYVADVDSSISATGLCSIKTAEDNPSKDSFLIDFSYYTTKGILDKTTTDSDLYGYNSNDMGYLKQLGYYNTQYDELSNRIINLSAESFVELESNVTVNLEGIETAQKQLIKLRKQLANYTSRIGDQTIEPTNTTYQNYLTKIKEQESILDSLIFETMCDGSTKQFQPIDNSSPSSYIKLFDNTSVTEFKASSLYKLHTYPYGMLGQYNKEYLQLQEWKKQQAAYLKEINKLSLTFYQKYEPYLKEGTWTDSNYLTDNAYYFGAKEVMAESCIPKVSYTIKVIALDSLPDYEDYVFNIADTTYIEDIGMFGINDKTGLPNRLKILISELNDDLDSPKDNSITVQNFTTQFEDLFKQVTATVQSLSMNTNIYKRASNFAANQTIEEQSLQGTLDSNELTLIKTEENNIEIDRNGQSGVDMNVHTNQYQLNGQGMSFSTDGGQTWDIGVGPSGINADYIKVGTLDAGKIRIMDNGYLYFFWDKDGIIAFREPQQNSDVNFDDFSLFNKYGLSLIEKGKVRLRAGYSYNGTDGDYIEEQTTGKDIGFFLYDNNGHIIFSTQTAESNESAQISLTGEMYAHSNSKEIEGISGRYYTYKQPHVCKIEKLYSYVLGTPVVIKYSDITYSQSIQFAPIDDYIRQQFLKQIVINGNTYYITLNDFNELISNSSTEKECNCYIRSANLQEYLISTSVFSEELVSNEVTTNYTEVEWYAAEDTNLYKKQNNTLIQSNKFLSTTNGTFQYWSSVTYQDKSSTKTDTQVGVFINNKNVTLESHSISMNNPYKGDRLLFIGSKGVSSIQNILTVQDNGILTMGGTVSTDSINLINEELSLDGLKDNITIENPFFVINGNGTGELRLSFEQIIDIDTNLSITSAISNSVMSALNSIPPHNHGIYSLNLGEFTTYAQNDINSLTSTIDKMKQNYLDDSDAALKVNIVQAIIYLANYITQFNNNCKNSWLPMTNLTEENNIDATQINPNWRDSEMP